MKGPESAFQKERSMLLGLAYRILGSRADAEDAVQDTYLKWTAANHDEIENPTAWLVSTCTRRSIDLLRAAHRSRVDYYGEWLPEPVPTNFAQEPFDRLELISSLETAFLLMLERLTPKERAAYLLHDIFELPYAEIATTLEIEEPACRKLVSRARSNISQNSVRTSTPRQKQLELLEAFHQAIQGNSPEPLTHLLSEDIRLTADGGGKVSSARRTVTGKTKVLRFIDKVICRFWPDFEWSVADLNGGLGAILRSEGKIVASLTFGFDENGVANHVFIVRNPDKLEALNALTD